MQNNDYKNEFRSPTRDYNKGNGNSVVAWLAAIVVTLLLLLGGFVVFSNTHATAVEPTIADGLLAHAKAHVQTLDVCALKDAE